MITLEMIERAGVFVPRSVEVAPLLFSEARNGGVKTSVPCEDGEVAWYSIKSGYTRHEFKKDKNLWRTAFPAKGTPKPKEGEMWLCKYAGENPGKTVWFVEPVQKMRKVGDFWTGIIYIFFGTAAIIIARDYGMGTALKMGPAYFPMVLSNLFSFIMTVLG